MQLLKSFQLQGGFAPLTGGSAPGPRLGLRPQTSDVNKDLTYKDQDKDQTLKDKDQTYKDKDQDKDCILVLKDQNAVLTAGLAGLKSLLFGFFCLPPSPYLTHDASCFMLNIDWTPLERGGE